MIFARETGTIHLERKFIAITYSTVKLLSDQGGPQLPPAPLPIQNPIHRRLRISLAAKIGGTRTSDWLDLPTGSLT